MSVPVDRVTSNKIKPEDYGIQGSKHYLFDVDDRDNNKLDVAQSYQEAENERFSSLPAVDTISSANPPQTSAISSEQADLTQAKPFSFSTLIDLGKKLWDWVCSPFTSKKEVEPVTGKVPDQAVQGISSTPSLQSPVLVTKEMMEKMIKELQEQAHRIEESTNETTDQNLSDEKRYFMHYLIQYQIRKDGIANIQFQFVFNQKRDHEIRKEQSDLQGQNIELEKSRKFWSTVNTAATVVAIAAMVATIAISAIASAGLSLVAIPAAVSAAISVGAQVTGAGATIIAGGSTIIKGGVEKQQGELQGSLEILNYKHKSLNETLRIESSTTNKEYNQALENYGLLKQMLDKMYKTSRVITAK
jgi:hypothetical protein